VVESNSAFISYRRDPGYASAWRIWNGLRAAGIDAFLDLESMRSAGDFDAKILNQIAGRPYFVLVLTDRTLERCKKKGDWLWRELLYAHEQRRIIVPAIIPPFRIDEASKHLPSKEVAHKLMASNGVSFPPEYFDDAIQTLVERLAAVDVGEQRLSPEDQAFAHGAAERTAQRPHDPHGEDDPTPHWPAVVASVLGLAVVIALAIWWFMRPDAELGSDLNANEMLEAGDHLTSVAGDHALTMTPGGRLIATTAGDPWWQQPSSPEPGSVAIMQDDGNFVIYPSPDRTSSDDALFATETRDQSGRAVLVIEDDGGRGVIVIRFGDGSSRVVSRQSLASDTPAAPAVAHTSPATTGTTPATSAPTTGLPVTPPATSAP